MIIPDGLVVSLAVLSILWTTATWDVVLGLVSRLIGFFALSLPMYLLTLFIRDAFGGGDIKLTAVCGFLLGWRLVLLAGFLAVLAGGCRAMFIRYIKRDKTVVHIAFGQYICAGVILSMLLGEELVGWYVSTWRI